MGLSISSLSTVDVIVPISVMGPAGPVDPTSDAVQFAFKNRGTTPVPSDWVAGSWAGTVNGAYWASCLVGPASGGANGGTALAIGTYVIWTKVIDSPEVPVEEAGLLTITP